MAGTRAAAHEGGGRALFRTIMPPIVLPVFLSSADGTVVATALPAIGASLGHVELLTWIVVANLIASTIAAPLYGKLGDLFGQRRMMMVSLAVFQTAALGCALAGSMWWLIAARVLQGLGGGGLMTLSQALIGLHVPARARGAYQGYLAACIMAGSGFGPVAGGVLTGAFGWHSVFLAYVPIGIAGMAMLSRLPQDERHGGAAGIDVAGTALLACFIVPLLVGVSRLQRPDPAAIPASLLLLAAAIGIGVLLLAHQRRAASPLLAIRLFRNPSFWRATVVSACSGASLVGMVTFLPLYFEVAGDASPAVAGLLLLPLTLGVSGGSVITGWLVSRTGRTAIFPACGLMVTAASLVFLALCAPLLDRVALAVVLAVGGLCQGSAMLVAQITVQTVSSPRQLGQAAGAVQLARALGSAFGAAAAGAVLFGLLATQDPGAVATFSKLLREGPDAMGLLDPARHALMQSALATAFRGVFLTIACFSCTIVAMAATMPVRRLEREPSHAT